MNFFRSTFCSLLLALSGFFSASASAESFTTNMTGCGGSFATQALLIACATSKEPSYTWTLFWTSKTAGNLRRNGSNWWGATATAFCADGTISNGVCVPNNPCPAKAGTTAIPSGQIGYGESAIGSNPTTGVLCDASQCLITINHASAIPIGGGEQANYITSATFTGVKSTDANCPLMVVAPTPKDPALPVPIDTVTPDANTVDGVPQTGDDCPTGSAFGQVNGVNVCAPSGSQIAYQPESTTMTTPGGDYSATSKTVDTVNLDGSITSKTTTTSTGAGGTSTTTTNSTSGGKTGLNGTNGKDGKTPTISLGPAPAAEGGEAPIIPGIAPGTGTDGAGGAEKVFSVGTRFTGSSSCIADKVINLSPMGFSVTVPLSQLCPWFDIIYKVVSMVSVFVALRILVMS